MEFINVVLRRLAPTCDCGLLNLDHVVASHSDGTLITVLKEKHPSGQPADPTVVLDVSESLAHFLPVLFDCLAIDACSWRLFCISFGASSNDLCWAISFCFWP